MVGHSGTIMPINMGEVMMDDTDILPTMCLEATRQIHKCLVKVCQMTKLKQFSNESDALYLRENNP